MPTEPARNPIVAKTIDFLKHTREPYALLFMHVIHRRFGIEEFADCGKRYDAVLPDHPDRAPVLRVFRRVFDSGNPVEPDDWEHIELPTDRLLVSALYCDRLGLPKSFPEVLERAIRQGGYAATHALLSWLWIRENGCELVVTDGFIERMYEAVAGIVDEDPTSINDVKLEAAAFLCLARQSARVDFGFVRRVIAIQNEDGGWGRAADGSGDPGGSSWHSTILALMLLLHVKFENLQVAAGQQFV